MDKRPSSPFPPREAKGEGDSVSLDSIPTFPAASLPAALEWAADDGKPCYLCDSDVNPMGLSIFFNSLDKTVLFRLHFVLDVLRQKGSTKARVPIYLYIQPDRIQSIMISGESPNNRPKVQDDRDRLGPSPLCLKLVLRRPADLVAPTFPLWPSKRAHRAMLHSLALLAEQTALTIHLRKDDAWSVAQLASICQAVSEHQLGPNVEVAELCKLYNGQGGKLISPGSLLTTSSSSAPQSDLNPPSYGELEPGPPAPPLYGSGEGSSHSNKKRQRTSSADEGAGISTADIAVFEAVSRRILAEHQLRTDDSQRVEREQLEKRVSLLEEALRGGLGQLEERVSRVEGRCEELSAQIDELSAQGDEIQEMVGDHSRHVDERVYLEVEDRVIGIRSDLEDFVKDELTSTAEAIKEQITRANVLIEFNDE